MATAAKRLKKDIDNITECPICSSEFRNPKLLYCGHTFCLYCLEEVVRGKAPGDKIPCPVCREKIEIPADGIHNFRTNLLISELIERKALVKQTVDENAVMCICNEDSERDPDKVAKWYCVYCGEKLCDQCRNVHRIQRVTKEHRVVEIGNEENKYLLNSKPNFCEKHTSEQIKLYCFDCKLPICTICYAVEHKNHRSGEIDVAAEEQRQILRKNYDILINRIKTHTNLLTAQTTEKSRFLEDVTRCSDNLGKRLVEIEKYAQAIKKKLQSVKIKHMKEMERNELKLKREFEILKTHSKTMREVIDKASAVDLCKDYEHLAKKAMEVNFGTSASTVLLLRIVFSPSCSNGAKDVVGSLTKFHSPTNVVPNLKSTLPLTPLGKHQAPLSVGKAPTPPPGTSGLSSRPLFNIRPQATLSQSNLFKHNRLLRTVDTLGQTTLNRSTFTSTISHIPLCSNLAELNTSTASLPEPYKPITAPRLDIVEKSSVRSQFLSQPTTSKAPFLTTSSSSSDSEYDHTIFTWK